MQREFVKTIGICVAILLIVGLSFIVGRASRKRSGADERVLWAALVNVPSANSVGRSALDCTLTNCGFHSLLRIWHQVDAAERALNRHVRFTTDLPLFLTRKPLVISETDEFKHALLPVLSGALVAENLTFADYLFMRRDVANALKTATVEENLADFISSVRMQEETFSKTYVKVTKAAKPEPVRQFEYTNSCGEGVLLYLKQGYHHAAYFDSFVGHLGPIYLPIYSGR